MTQFHEGQEVEVRKQIMLRDPAGTIREWWEPAKIVDAMVHKDDPKNDRYEAQFPDGTRAVSNAENIRDRFPLDNHQIRFGSSPSSRPTIHEQTILRVSSNDPMGTRPMTKDEVRDYKADLAQAHDEALQAEGKP